MILCHDIDNVILYYVLYYIMPCYIIQCDVYLLCPNIFQHIILYHVSLCCFMVCYLYHVILRSESHFRYERRGDLSTVALSLATT